MVNPWHDIGIGKKAPRVVNSIIEIPKDSKIKYEFDKDSGMLKLDRFLYSSVHYPGDYGFIPQTFCEDKDPLDVLILTGHPVYPLTIAEIRPLGVIRMSDSGERDDKVIAVYNDDPRFKEYDSLRDIPKHTIEELKNFFEIYKQLQGKETKILKILGKKHALQNIRKSRELYERTNFGKE